jgi:hypothetical protein
MPMPEKSEYQITLFIRDEKTGRYAFNAKALTHSKNWNGEFSRQALQIRSVRGQQNAGGPIDAMQHIEVGADDVISAISYV